jgi:hypothetical protein
MRALPLLLVIAIAGSPAVADPRPRKPAPTTKKDPADKPAPPPAPTRTPGPADAKVIALLDKIAAGPDREKSIAELDQVAPEAVDAIGEWLQRPRTNSVDDRKKILVAIKADVPDKTGRFVALRNTDVKADDKQVDWLKELLAKGDESPAAGEVIADVAAIRALSATKQIKAAQWLFDTAFPQPTIIYRDECGRYVRKMHPYSIPTLTKESWSDNFDRKRYATWQLERLDRQDAFKAMSAATGDETLQVAILDAFREVHHREAVGAVWKYVNADSQLVRAAARKTWMEYITGPAPRPAPRQRLKLPGGKMTKYPKPLWLTYRELADTELRRAANELLHEDYAIDEQAVDDNVKDIKATPIDLEDVTKRLFAYYDDERKKRDGEQWLAAKKLSDKGDLAGAAKLLDQLIAQNPDRGERVEMAKVYASYAKQLETGSKWGEASVAYLKAYGLDPKKPTLAAHHYTLGKSLEAAGKDGGPDYRAAVRLDPDYAPAKTEADRVSSSGARPEWMLYAAISAGALAMMLFAAAMLRRKSA